MDIAEKRKPQDGRITIMVDRREFDVRVSVLPTVYGEKIVMRLTSKEGLTKQLASNRTNKMGIIWNYIAAQKLGIDYDLNAKIYEQLPQLTLQNVVDFAKQRIADKPYRYLILGDEKELDMKSLEKIGPVRRLTTKEVFGY